MLKVLLRSLPVVVVFVFAVVPLFRQFLLSDVPQSYLVGAFPTQVCCETRVTQALLQGKSTSRDRVLSPVPVLLAPLLRPALANRRSILETRSIGATTLRESSSSNNDEGSGNMRRNDDDKETFATERDALLGADVVVSGEHEPLHVCSEGNANTTETAYIYHAEDADTTSNSISTTTGQRILQLAIPAAGALLIDPLLTVTDTAFVGRFSVDGSSAPLAGMGSAAALLTFSFYLFNFLCTATTPLVAQRRAAGDMAGAVSVAGQALSLALVLGVLLTVLLSTWQQPLLTLMGTEQTGANTYAAQFLAIRALAAPAVLTMEAATGVLRGYLDTATPVRVLIASNLVNLALDVVLIVGLQLGPLGAAVATTTAEWISASLFLLVLAGRLPSQAPELGSNVSGAVAATRIMPLGRLPAWSEVRSLLSASSSVLLRTLVLQLALSAAAATAARMSGDAAAASVAAHQIGLQLWILCSFLCDSLAAASQGLVADAIGRNDSKDVKDVATTIFVYSLVLGVALAVLLQIGASTGWLLNVFTQDVATKTALSGILPLLVAAQPLNALVFAADGVLQGASQFSYQAVAMLLSGMTAVATFVWLTETSASSSSDTLVHVWVALIVLQSMRGLTSLWKLLDANGPVNLLGLEKRF